MIGGPPGIGKSSLLAATASMAINREVGVLRARGNELERDVPFGVALQAVGTTPPAESTRPPGAPRASTRLSTSAPDGVLVSGDEITVGCQVTGAAVESCEADAFVNSAAARLVRIGHGRTAGAGAVHVRLTRAGVKRLRARGRASRLLIRITARVEGDARMLRSRESVRVLLPGTALLPRGKFRHGRLGLALRRSLERFAKDLSGARVVRCEAGGPIRAERACAFLRKHGVRARLTPVTAERAAPRRLRLKVMR